MSRNSISDSRKSRNPSAYGLAMNPRASRLVETLTERARADPRISGVAQFGSAAHPDQQTDEWSDVDLALRTNPADLDGVVEDWTAHMYSHHGAVHHLDVQATNGLYRVFLLEPVLQVDLLFTDPEHFGPVGPAWR